MTIFQRLFLASGVAITLALATGGALSFHAVRQELLPREYARVSVDVRGTAHLLEEYTASSRKNANLLVRSPALAGFLRASAAGGIDPQTRRTLSEWQHEVTDLFLALARSDEEIVQVRLIGVADGGREVIRVHRNAANAGRVEVVSAANLQRKGHRAYFAAALRAPNVFVSQLNLNREHGRVQVPHQPVLRVASPVLLPDGERWGIVVVNLDMRAALAEVHESTADLQTFVISESGQFLAHPDPAATFGGDLGHDRTLTSDFPDLARKLTQLEQGARVVALHGVDHVAASSTARLAGGRPVTVIGVTPHDVVAAALTPLATSLLTALALALPLLLLGMYRLTRSVARPLSEIAGAATQFGSEGRASLPSYARGEIGTLVQSMQTMFDEIDRRRTEENELRERLSQSQRLESLGLLAGGVAHDFNNLLTVIIGSGGLLIATMDEADPARAQLQNIVDAGERAAKLTAQLLAFGRKQIVRPDVVDLNEVVRRVTPLLKTVLREDISQRWHLAEQGQTVRIDPTQLEQVLLNLAINARDAMPEGGTLTVETSRVVLDEDYCSQHPGAVPGPHAMLAVADSGEGMDTATKERIFEPFFTSKELGHGTGLGLATVYGIVHQSGGSIYVYSEPQRGTVFKIYLPLSETPIASKREAPRAPERTDKLGSETILVVEDAPAVATFLSEVLRGAGYNVLHAADGEAAIALSEQTPGSIQLVLTDVVLPKLSGKAVAELTRSKRPDVRVLYMSGYTANVIVHQGELEADVEFIPKPFTAVELLTRVRHVLGPCP